MSDRDLVDQLEARILSDQELVDQLQARLQADPVLRRGLAAVIPFRCRYPDAQIVRALDSLAAHWAAVRTEEPSP